MEHKYDKNKECPICDSLNSKDYISAIDHNVSKDIFHISKCDKCNFRFTNPKPTKETIGQYYKSEKYISHSGTKKGIINYIYHIVRNHQLKKKESLISSFANNKSILDIGCGTGEFLNYCKNKGWNSTGIEPDNKARNFGITNYNLLIESSISNINKESFSIITMWHVLEHMYNLKSSLSKVRSLLNKNGFLIIAVPNCLSYDAQYYKENWAAYDLPIHLYHFTKNDILFLADKIGFKLIEIKPLIFDSYYVSMLSEKKKGGFLLNGILIGIKSNFYAKKQNNYSSLIYILQKNDLPKP